MFIDQKQVQALLDWPGLINEIDNIFKTGCDMPMRHHHSVKVPNKADATLLLMPAWTQNGYLGVKLVNVFPSNGDQGLPSIHSVYVLSSAKTGEQLAIMDGGELTARRTAAASALASRYLSRQDASTLLMVGTGRLSLNLIQAHASERPIKKVNIWGRRSQAIASLASKVEALGFSVAVFEGDGLAQAVKESHIVSCATLSASPLIKGDWLSPGTHVDLVGGFTPAMREADDEAVRRSRVYVDTRTGAMKEAGDIVVPLQTGVLKPAQICADLYDLCRQDQGLPHAGGEVITLFKSVGAACEDLAGAVYAYRQQVARASDA